MTNIEEFSSWLARTNRSANTIRMYTTKVSDFQDSGLSATNWLHKGKEDGLSDSSIKMMLASVRSFYKFSGIVDPELLEYNPPIMADPIPHPVPGGLSVVREVMATLPQGSPHRVAIALGSLAGCRVSETVSLTQDSIVISKLIIKGKGSKYRHVPISEELAHELSAVETHRLVPINNPSARKAITSAFTRCGYYGHNDKPVSSHDLRATFATAVYEKTLDIKLVSELLGHSSVKQTQTYIGINDAAKYEAVNL